MNALEETPFLKGTLKVFQPRKGYRFSLDSVLLANFIELKKKEKVLEIGAGTGIISFILLKKYLLNMIYLLEIEPIFLKALRLGVKANFLENRALLIKGDALRTPFRREYFDVIYSNPPYFKKESGRESPFYLENLARREENFSLPLFLKNCASLLKNKGRFYLIFTASRLAELITTLKSVQLEPKVVRLVHPYPGKEANLVLIKALKGAREEIRVLPPLYIYLGKGKSYTEEVKNFLEPLSEPT